MKKKLTILFIVVGLLFSIIGFMFWYILYDVTGLTLYKDEPIREIYFHHDRAYLITEDGKGYMSGGYGGRKYDNSQRHYNKNLNGASSPVLFFDGCIDEVVIYETGILFTSDNGDLYDFSSFDEGAKKIASSVETFSRFEEYEYFDIFYIDKSGALNLLRDGKTTELLKSGVKKVYTYFERVFILAENNDVCELKITADGFNIGEVLFSNVKDFNIQNTCNRFINGVFVDDDEEALKTHIMNVLTLDGILYAKGAYSYHQYFLGNEKLDPKIFDEWTVIGENVQEFSLASMGTVMRYKDNSVGYIGFNTKVNVNDGASFESKVLAVSNAKLVRAYTMGVYVKTTNGEHYVWGQSNAFLRYNKNRDKRLNALDVLRDNPEVFCVE